LLGLHVTIDLGHVLCMQAQQRIQDRCDMVEKKLLTLFGEAYSRDDIAAMHVCPGTSRAMACQLHQ
jgi:hypothetical protein